jgi:hypothetical protein
MNNKAFNVRSILAGEAPNEAAITVKGWVRTRRDSKAGICPPVGRIFVSSGSGGRAEYSTQLCR